MTKSLSDRLKTELVDMARKRGIIGWHAMTKDDLVRALTADPGGAGGPAKPAVNGARPTNGSALPKPLPVAKPRAASNGKAAGPVIAPDKDLSARTAKAGLVVKDQLLLTAPDPFWLHAQWQLSIQSIQRAEAALGQDWHGSRPILRLLDVTSGDTTSTSEATVRDLSIHGGCNHWYLEVPQPPRAYRVDIGYVTRAGRFFPLTRSNVISPPVAGSSEALDEGWAGGLDDKGAPPPADGAARDGVFGAGAALPGKLKKFAFELDAELIVHGQTDPSATVTLHNEAVKLRPDGKFTMRLSLPDSRQIIPAVATSADGMEEQTIVLAVERNTKRLDPMIHDLYGEG